MNTEQQLAKAVNAMCETNPITRGAVADSILMTPYALVIPLRRPVVVEGEALDVSQTVDILDLIDAFQREQSRTN